jgi:hypothetical protein
MKEYIVKSKQEAIDLAFELTDDKQAQQTAIDMWEFMKTFTVCGDITYATYTVMAPNPIQVIHFPCEEVA